MASEIVFPCVEDRLELGAGVYLAPQTYVHGAVRLGDDTSIWPMSVVRGDKGYIQIGARVNIQDGCVLHADPDAWLTIGDDVSVGHGAIVHGCTVEDEVLIGMGAVVLNHARIGRGSLVAARALVTEGMVVPPGSLVVGIPGKVRPLGEGHQGRILRTAQNYVALKNAYLSKNAESR